MRSVHEVLKQKENDLQMIQKEIEALRLVVRLLTGDDEPEEVRPINAVSVAASLASESTPRQVMQGFSSGAPNYGASETLKQFP
jgi:hypothetical protein